MPGNNCSTSLLCVETGKLAYSDRMEIQHHPLPEAPWQGPESPRVNRQASGGALAFDVFAST